MKNKDKIEYCLICFFVIVLFSNNYGQGLTLTKEEIFEVENLEEVFSGADKKSKAKLYAFTPSNEKRFKKTPGYVIATHKKNSNGEKNSVKLSTQYDWDNSIMKVNKVVNGVHQKEPQVTLSVEGSVTQIDNTGKFFYSDFSHGDGTTYLFFDSDFNQVNQYSPYDYFVNCIEDISEGSIFIAAQEDFGSREIKLAKLTFIGDVIKETTLETDGDGIFNLLCKNGKLIVLLRGNSDTSPYRLAALDSNLELLWNTGVGFVPRHDIRITKNNNILSLTPHKIYLLDEGTGKEIWAHSISKVKALESVLDNEFLAVVSDETASRKLVLINKKTGQSEYSTSIEVDQKYPTIIDDGKQFFIRKKSSLLKFEKQ